MVTNTSPQRGVTLQAEYMKRPRVDMVTFNVGTDKEHTMITPYYGRYGYSINSIGDGKFQYDVFYDDVYGGVIYADKLELAIPIALAHKDSEFYFCAMNAKVKIQRRKVYESNKYDEHGLLVDYFPRKSATLVK